MKSRLNLICSMMAILCFISMYMPVIAPRYPASDYFPASGSDYSREYYYSGDYYWAREYWDITRFVFSSNSAAGRVALSVAQALLLLWALMSVRGEAGRLGLWASGLNLAAAAFALIRMLGAMGYCRWGVLTVLALDAMAAVALAVATSGPLPRPLRGGLSRFLHRRRKRES